MQAPETTQKAELIIGRHFKHVNESLEETRGTFTSAATKAKKIEVKAQFEQGGIYLPARVVKADEWEGITLV
jgi:hypothetical protein